MEIGGGDSIVDLERAKVVGSCLSMNVSWLTQFP